MKELRIVVADDHGLVRAGIRSLLERMAGVEVVGEAADGREALRLIREQRPDLAVIDISMPGLNGLDATARAKKECSKTRIILISVHDDQQYVDGALRAGAAGYVLKDAEPVELELAVRAVARGDVWLSPAISRKLMAAARRPPVAGASPGASLTSRQREVLQLVAEGNSTKRIALRLGISPKTVDSHRAELMTRLGVGSVAGLVRCALALGLVRNDDKLPCDAPRGFPGADGPGS